MAKGVAFTPANAERILRAVEAVERGNQNLPHQPPRAKVGQVGFFAKLTDTDGSGAYSWQAVLPNDTYDMTADPTQWDGTHTDSTGWAYQVPDKSKDVPTDEIVWLVGARKHNVFQFQYHPGVKPGRTTSTISKRSGSTPGYGNVMIEKLDTTAGTLSDHEEVEVYNNFPATVPSGRKVQITFGEGGKWWLTAEECDTDSTSSY